MKVLFLIAQLSRGGQERQLLYLLSSLDRKIIQSTIYVWNLDENEAYYKILQKSGVKILGSSPNENALKKLIHLRRVVRYEKIMIVQSFTFYLNFITYVTCIGLKTFAIGGLRHILEASMEVHGIVRGTLNAIFPIKTIVNNYTGAEQIKNKFKFLKKNNTYVISNKLDIKSFVNEEINFDDTQINTISISSLMPLKRIDIMVSVIETLKNKGYNVKHIHVGEGKETKLIESLIKEKKLQDKFILVGEKDNISSIINQCHFLIHTADAEGMPNVIMEAMACGRPVVTTDCGDARYMVTNDETGFVLPIRDLNGLVEKAEVLIKNNDLMKNMGINARKFAEANFDLHKLGADYTKFYNDLLYNKRHFWL